MARIPIPVGAWGNISISGTRGNYRATARFRLANGKTVPRFRGGATKEAARNALLEHLTELRDQTIGGEVSGAVTLGSFADDWFTRWRESSDPPASTVRTYRAAVKWIREELGMLRLTECTTGRLEKGVARIGEAHGQTTAKQSRSVLRRIFADAVRLDALTANPALGVSTIKDAPQMVRAMTADEVQALRTAATTWEATPVTSNKPVRREIADSIDVMLGTGIRTGELLGMRWDDVDLDADVPTVSVMGTVTRGADDEGMIYQPAPKSETSKRVLYLPTIAVDALRRQFDVREFRPESEGIFASEFGTWRDPSNYRAHFREVRAMAGLDWVTPKTIRKTVATAIYSADGLDNASQQLGHSEVGVTAKHYVQRLNIGPAGVVGVLDEWLQSAS
ncbi:site-specific integrase [Brevibacterium antiquum]|uniref:site-specific integrase n=1 Tax=Brevibacterium antiquum TaxID=234835 RepID=UPI0011AEC71E|nr:tyrosine-type recombinase/integrase [Brevibacterium antiquum]